MDYTQSGITHLKIDNRCNILSFSQGNNITVNELVSFSRSFTLLEKGLCFFLYKKVRDLQKSFQVTFFESLGIFGFQIL